MALGVEFEDAHTDQLAVLAQGVHVDGKRMLALALLEPGAGGPRGQTAELRGLDQLRRALGRGRNVVADRKSQHHEAAAQHQQGAQGHPGPHATGAHDGEFRALGQPGHDVDRADEHGDGQQLVEVAGQAQQHEQQGVRRLVGFAAGAADPAQFVDQVEKEKQGQKSQGHEGHGRNGIAVDQAAQDFHGATALFLDGQSERIDQRWCRASSTPSPHSSVPPCSSAMKPSAPMRPAPTQLCPKVMRL
ncbi:hypothetical protein D3C78_1216880 [compost metagenome]